jgi:Arc/MetJ family transcription regulator
MMRTNIVLDEALVAEAMRYAPVKSKRELVDMALREFVANRRRRDMRELFGSVEIDPDYDYKALRIGAIGPEGDGA